MIYNNFICVVQQERPAAIPKGYTMESFDVEKLSTNQWSISLTPGNCGYGLPLMGVCGGVQKGSGGQDDATYGFQGVLSTVNVSRTQATTKPTGGNFSLSYQGQTIPGTLTLGRPSYLQ